MGFFSGVGRGLRGILEVASGPRTLIGSDFGAQAQLRERQLRLRPAQGASMDARRKAVLQQLIMQGLDPAQAELALINPDFARQFVPGFGASTPAPAGKLDMADPSGGGFERGHTSLPAGLHGDGSQPDRVSSHIRQPGSHFVADPFQTPSQGNRLALHSGDGVSPTPAIETWRTEPDRYGAQLQLAGQDGFDRSSEIRSAQESARRAGRDYREILNERRGLPSGLRQTPSQPAPAPTVGPSPSRPTRAAAGQSAAQPAPRQADDSTQRPPGRTITLTEADVLNLKRTLATEWVIRAGGPDQARGIIDTILNRLASGQWGSTVSEVVNQEGQFSDINGNVAWTDGRHSVEEIPDSRVSQVVRDFVDTYLAERAEGRESSVGTHLNYANPHFSDEENLPWIMALDGPVYGSGEAIHRHGTTSDRERYRPDPYSIESPTSPEQ